MRLYTPGLPAALEVVRAMDFDALLAHVDSLYGRANLPEGATVDELRAEAENQTRVDFRNPEAKAEWEHIDELTRQSRAMSRGAGAP